MKTLLST